MNDLLHGQKTGSTGPVECLGQTFPSEHSRREHFTKLLAEKLKDPAFRKIEGFPQGTDEAILAVLHRVPEPVSRRFRSSLRQAI